MFKKSIASMIMGLFAPSFAAPSVDMLNEQHTQILKKGKGQLRNTASKPSGAAQFKRNAKKRNNINKSKGK